MPRSRPEAGPRGPRSRGRGEPAAEDPAADGEAAAEDPAADGRAAAGEPAADGENGPLAPVAGAGDDEPAGQADLADCERRAVALLARREHSRLELERKLAARGFPRPLITEMLDALEQTGLLSGQRFIESFISARAARGSGPAKIRAELAQRGIRSDEAAAALRAADEDWTALARRVRSKRFGQPAPRDFTERARQARFLQGRGFEPDQIDAALEVAADSD